jgi:hypothetical protein
MIKWMVHAECMTKRRYEGKVEGKRLMHRYEDNIKPDLKKKK